ncbi:PadR family transcriptional regulator [candidate division KSB1 bacterium]
MRLLTRAEEIVLLSVWRLQDDAYSVKIREQIAKLTEKEWAFGAIFVTLDRLVKEKLVTSFLSEPTSERGGRRKRIYQVTQGGLRAMVDIKEFEKTMWEDLPVIKLKRN